jgi:hypothetical protein
MYMCSAEPTHRIRRLQYCKRLFKGTVFSCISTTTAFNFRGQVSLLGIASASRRHFEATSGRLISGFCMPISLYVSSSYRQWNSLVKRASLHFSVSNSLFLRKDLTLVVWLFMKRSCKSILQMSGLFSHNGNLFFKQALPNNMFVLNFVKPIVLSAKKSGLKL